MRIILERPLDHLGERRTSKSGRVFFGVRRTDVGEYSIVKRRFRQWNQRGDQVFVDWFDDPDVVEWRETFTAARNSARDMVDDDLALLRATRKAITSTQAGDVPELTD